MRKLAHIFRAAAAAFATLLYVSAAVALTIPPTFAPRQFNTQQKHYIRFTVNFNSCVLASGSCSFKVGALPPNAFLTDIWQDVTTAFNAGTTNTVSLGTASTALTGIQAAITVASTTLVHYCGTSCGSGTFAGIGLAVTSGTAQTGADGGYDIWVGLTESGTAPTAGVAVYIIEYIAPNDGNCTTVPMNTTPTVC